jgi:hypothetical protein
MPVWGMAALLGLLGAVAGWAIWRDLKAGISGDDLYRFREDSNPLGFAAMIAGKLFVLAFGVAQILYAAGWGDDPMLLLRKIFG